MVAFIKLPELDGKGACPGEGGYREENEAPTLLPHLLPEGAEKFEVGTDSPSHTSPPSLAINQFRHLLTAQQQPVPLPAILLPASPHPEHQALSQPTATDTGCPPNVQTHLE